MSEKLVLFADNNEDFLDTRATFLERAGFTVIKAHSVSEAISVLKNRWIHVAVLDIRLEDDNDQNDTSGLELAKDPAFRHIPKIILTGYPAYEYVREALGPALQGLPPAVDFVAKKETARAMVDAVQQAYDKHLALNRDLAIHFGERCPWNFANLAAMLVSDTGNNYQSDIALEFEDLLRRLFVTSDQITLDRLLWRRGRRLALSVLAYEEGIPDRHTVVICGRIGSIRRERKNTEKLGLTSSTTGNPNLTRFKETLRFGANCYELAGSNLETIKPFDRFFSQNPPRKISETLARLIDTGLNPWHRQAQLVRAENDLSALYTQRMEINTGDHLATALMEKTGGIGREAADAGLANIEVDRQKLVVQFPKGLREVYPNPTVWIDGALPAPKASATLYGMTLGPLQLETILVDQEGKTWLTDFGAVARGPLLGDYAALEIAVKFSLVDDTVTLMDLHEFEHALLSANHLNQRLDPGAQQFNKVVSAVQRIRQKAASACGIDILPYYWGMLFCVAERILTYERGVRRTRRELLPLVHACMSMGMICAKLTALDQATDVPFGENSTLEIDEVVREVRIGQRTVSLSPMEYVALLFLWCHSEQLCTRRQIFETIYDRPYESGPVASDDSSLNMVIKRIREKIELDPGEPRFLIGKRGVGYVLYPRGRTD